MTDSPLSARTTWLYLQASLIGTLVNFVSRFPLAEVMSFGASVVAANYFGMVLVFLLSYKRAFAAERANRKMILRFAAVAHAGLVVTWLSALAAREAAFFAAPALFDATSATALLASFNLDGVSPLLTGAVLMRLTEGFCHGCGIVTGFVCNYLGHSLYSFKK